MNVIQKNRPKQAFLIVFENTVPLATGRWSRIHLFTLTKAVISPPFNVIRWSFLPSPLSGAAQRSVFLTFVLMFVFHHRLSTLSVRQHLILAFISQ